MNFRDLVPLVLSNLNRMRGRVIMTSMGVVIGTAAIVVLLSLATGLRRSTVEDVEQFGGVNQITVFTRARFGDTSAENLTPAVLDELEQIEGVVAVTPNEQFSGQSTLKYNRLEGFATINGIDPRVVPDMGFEVAEGTDQLNPGTVLIGASVGDSFGEAGQSSGGRRGGFGPPGMPFGGGGNQDSSEANPDAPDLYGRTILLEMRRVNDDGETETRTERLRVGGVLEATGGQQDYDIYMSIDDLEDLLTWSRGERPDWDQDGYGQVIVIAEQDTQVMLDVTNEITERGYFAMSSTSVVESLNTVFLIIEAVLGGVASIALLVAAIGIANTMVMSVLERTREIGLMKAIGARNRDVLAVFLTEAATIGLLGGIVGVIVGIVVSQVIDLFAAGYLSSGGSEVSSVVALPLWLPLFAILFSVVIGLAAGIYPAFRAVQLDPVRALKYE